VAQGVDPEFKPQKKEKDLNGKFYVTCFLQQSKVKNRAGGVVQECLLCKCEAPSLNSSPTKKNK
jgi:hypothetical protein